ncbi:MAG: prepilin-type N-terminal cleavage/methylation domain-containing protein, partial [Kiritimatiellia bacterium]|nr:prepilin-type N-terminal cleavage/methylation domain-containing protein [Kiritimatiellia bacterium]
MRIVRDIFRTLRNGRRRAFYALPTTHSPLPTTHCPLPTTNYQLPTKSGFTLIELLIVTVVILALMGVMFRLTGIASGA